jgi:SAM-dependent methyltransferase
MEGQVYQQFLDLENNHWWFRGRRSVYIGLLKAHLGNRTAGRALDLGCGLGGFLPSLAGLGYEVYGADMDLTSLVHCRDRGFDRVILSDSYSLPFPDDSFDLVAMFDAIEHVEHDDRAMAEVARVLKPGGKVIISVPAYQFLFANNDRVAQHYRRYNRTTVRRLFEQAGLRVERNSHSNVFLFPVILPLVLLIKLLEGLTAKAAPQQQHSNLSWPLPRWLHAVLYRIFAAELVLGRHFDWPAGHSIVAIAGLPDAASPAAQAPD